MLSVVKRLVDFVYPPVCGVCSKRLRQTPNSPSHIHLSPIHLEQPSFEHQLCEKCLITNNVALQPKNFTVLDEDTFCTSCGEFSITESPVPNLCLYCFLWPLPSRQLRSLWRFEHQAEAVVKAYKYGLRTQLVKFISQAMLKGIREQKLFAQTDWDYVIPMPSIESATRARGFAHMSFIARHLAGKLQIECNPSVLSFNRSQQQQTTVNIEKRYDNVRASFYVSKYSKALIREKKILLIDDVLTTGASCANASMCLLDAGCEVVDIYTVCRSVNFYKRRLSLARSLNRTLAKQLNRQLNRKLQ